ncbi:MAG: hypothetical protein ACE5GW_11720 [Planctomycetota bacterium]
MPGTSIAILILLTGLGILILTRLVATDLKRRAILRRREQFQMRHRQAREQVARLLADPPPIEASSEERDPRPGEAASPASLTEPTIAPEKIISRVPPILEEVEGAAREDPDVFSAAIHHLLSDDRPGKPAQRPVGPDPSP